MNEKLKWLLLGVMFLLMIATQLWHALD